MILLFTLACSSPAPGPLDSGLEELTDDTAAPADSGSEVDDAPSFAEVHELLSEHCGTCHTAGYVGNFLVEDDLQASYDLLLGTATPDAEARYVLPGDPEGSLLMDKLSAQPSFGEAMPPEDSEAARLDDDEVALLRAWILAGAPGP